MYVDIPLSLLLISFDYLCLTTHLHMPHGIFLHMYDSSITLIVLPCASDTECNATGSDKGANKTHLQVPST